MAVYLGSDGLNGLVRMQSGELNPGDLELIHIQKCLMVSFNDRKYVNPIDLQIIKQLGLKFRGTNAWPVFRSYEPGYTPWHLTSKEQVQFLTLAIIQAIEIAEHFKPNPDILFVDNDNRYWVSIAEWVNDTVYWTCQRMSPASIEKSLSKLQDYDELRLKKIQDSVRHRAGIWEVDCFYSPFVVKEGDRPFYPLMLLFVDHQSGQILHFQLANGAGDIPEFADEFMKLTKRMNMMPESIWVPNQTVRDYVSDMTSGCGIYCKIESNLTSIMEAKENMLQYLGKG